MRILSVNKFYYIYGGSDRYFFELNALHRRAGHKVVPFAMKHPENLSSPYDRHFVSQVNYWDNPNLREKIKAAGRVLYSVEARRWVRELIENAKPDIAHIHLIYHQISPAILPVIREYGIPIVQTLHDYKPICPTYSLISWGRICERCRGKRFYHAALQRCNHGSLSASMLNSVEMYLHHALGWYDLPDVYITPSDFMRRKMIEFGMPSEKFVHIPNFVDADKYGYSDTTDDYFVYIGRLVSIKGVATLLRTMARMQSQSVKLAIVGDGPQRSELESLKIQLGLENVDFLGYQSGEKLEALIASAMFSVLPSECYENCPMSVLESMAMGKPVIGARIGGIPELISHGEDGMLFESGSVDDLADKIDYMLTDPQRCQEMGMRAREKVVVHYNPKVHHRQILAVYQQLL